MLTELEREMKDVLEAMGERYAFKHCGFDDCPYCLGEYTLALRVKVILAKAEAKERAELDRLNRMALADSGYMPASEYVRECGPDDGSYLR